MPRSLDFYAQASPMTALGGLAEMLAEFPLRAPDLVSLIEGLIISNTAMLCDRPVDRWNEDHLRHVSQMLQRLVRLGSRNLSESRPPSRRLSGGCHHAALLIAAILRARRIPARLRVGYVPHLHQDPVECHHVVEYWSSWGRRWLRLNPQVGCGRSRTAAFAFHVFDMRQGNFVTASEAWLDCRSRGSHGWPLEVSEGERRDLRQIAGDLMRDFAALNAMEMLPWDVWGAMPVTKRALTNSLALFDRVAVLTRSPDNSFGELVNLYESEAGLRVPATVFNARRGIYELVRSPVDVTPN